MIKIEIEKDSNLSLMEKAMWIAGTEPSRFHSLADIQQAGLSLSPDAIISLWDIVCWLRREVYMSG
jgi:hypothetical protein